MHHVMYFTLSVIVALAVLSAVYLMPQAEVYVPRPYLAFKPLSGGVAVYAHDAGGGQASRIYYFVNDVLRNVTGGYGYVGRAACGDKVDVLYEYKDGRKWLLSGIIRCTSPRQVGLESRFTYDATNDVLHAAVKTLKSGSEYAAYIRCGPEGMADYYIYLPEPLARLNRSYVTFYDSIPPKTYDVGGVELSRVGPYTLLKVSNVTWWGDAQYKRFAVVEVGVRPKAGVGSDFDAFKKVAFAMWVSMVSSSCSGGTCVDVYDAYLNGTRIGTCKYTTVVEERTEVKREVNVTKKPVHGVIDASYCINGMKYKTSTLWRGNAATSVTSPVEGECTIPAIEIKTPWGNITIAEIALVDTPNNRTAILDHGVQQLIALAEAMNATAPDGTKLGQFLEELYKKDPHLAYKLIFGGAYGDALQLQVGDPYKRSERVLTYTVRVITDSSSSGDTQVVAGTFDALAVPGFTFATMGIAPFRTVNFTAPVK